MQFQGLGAVGFYLAEDYLKEGAELIVCDMDEKAIKALKEAHPESSIESVDPNEIYFVDADIFSPCAIGGILTKERIKQMKFKLIMGPANNQLKASSQEEEYELARELDKAGDSVPGCLVAQRRRRYVGIRGVHQERKSIHG